MRKALVVLAMASLCVSQAAFAVDDGQTQPKVSIAVNNSSSTPTDLIALTNGSGNVKGVLCALTQASGNFTSAVVKFYVDGGGAQTVSLDETYQPQATIGGTTYGYTGWVPFNVRFSSSIRITIQKSGGSGGQIDCTAAWALD
jgi:hypothetical protein